MWLILWLRRLMAVRSALRTALALIGFAVLVLLQLLGNWIARAAHAPIPGSVIGMVLLAAGIHLGVIPRRLVRAAAELLVRHLALLYVPAGVALILYVALVRREWLPIAGGALVSLVSVLAVVGVVADRTERATGDSAPVTSADEDIVEPVLTEEP